MKRSLSHNEEQLIVEAIASAEKKTSGEIRVHIESTCKGDPLDRGADLFFELGMEKTRDRNGVLVYVALADRKLAILGDAGINKVVPAGFWDESKEIMVRHFRESKYAEGISEAVLKAGEELGKYFPLLSGDTNELSNEISRGND
jgi:uncharacterized membrane protein